MTSGKRVPAAVTDRLAARTDAPGDSRKTAAKMAIVGPVGTESVIQHLKITRECYQVHCKPPLIMSPLHYSPNGFSDLVRWRDTQ